MIGHDEDDAGADEGELDDERVEVGRRLGDQAAQDVQLEVLASLLVLLGLLDPVQKWVARALATLPDTFTLEWLASPGHKMSQYEHRPILAAYVW